MLMNSVALFTTENRDPRCQTQPLKLLSVDCLKASRVLFILAVLVALPTSAQQEQRKEQPTEQDNTSNPRSDKNGQQHGSGDSNSKKNDESYERWFFEFLEHHDSAIVALGTLALVGVTLILAIATFFLWWATRALVKGAEDTAQRQLRAYVFVAFADLRNVGVGGPMIGTVRIVNNGQTPAYKLVGWTRLGFDTKLGVGDLTPFNLGPRGAQFSYTVTGKLVLTEADYAGIVQGKTPVYVYGEIRYEDAFGKKQFTRFRLMYKGDGIARSPQTMLPMVGAPEGNEIS